MLYYMLRFLGNSCFIILCVPLIAIIPVLLIVSLILIIGKKFRNKIKLKKPFFIGFFIFEMLSVLFETFNYNKNIIGFLVGNFGGGIMMLCNLAQAFCFASGITLMTAYIIISIHKKITLKRKRGLNALE